MKKRILGILTLALALSMVFTMVSCGGEPEGDDDITIKFEPNGGTLVGAGSATIAKGKSLGSAFPADPVWAGHTFDGWFMPDGTPATSATVFNSSTTIKAEWTAVPEGSVLITFVPGYTGAPSIPSITIPENTAIGELPVPESRPGYTFEGWYDGDDLVTASTTFSTHTTLTAKWEAVPEGSVLITFHLNYEGAPTIAAKAIEENTAIGDGFLPVPAAREGFVFGGWWDLAETTQYDATSTFAENTTLYAKWIPDVLDGSDADELLYLTNGAHAIYQFDIPDGFKLGDYSTITVDYKISNAGLAAWDTNGIRYLRLYGVYTSITPTTVTGSAQSPQIRYYNISGNDASGESLNAPYILERKDNTAVKNTITANEWFTVTYTTDGTAANSGEGIHPLPNATGTVYFGIGIAPQHIGTHGREATFIQLVKDIKLLPKAGAPDVPGLKPVDAPAQFLTPGYTPGQFIANNDPIVYEWRAEPTQDNIDNWRDLVPEIIIVEPEVPFDRGAPPADADLEEVVLGDFTYINRGNPDRQLGWTSFTEAGRANDQSYTGAPSVIAYENFKEAWYLVVETETLPTGTLTLVWMGGAGGWNGKATTGTDGAPTAGITTITNKTGGGHIIKILLPEALDNYQKYYEDNPEWAALAFSYWGADNTTLRTLDITKAYLLVEDPLPEAKGLAAAFGFTLGTAPAGGDLIKDVVLDKEGEALEITTASGLSDFVWYVDGVKDAEDSGTLTLTVKAGGDEDGKGAIDIDKLTITVQAKRGALWVSQTVFITVGN